MFGKNCYAAATAFCLVLMLSGCTAGILTGTLVGGMSNTNQNGSTFNGTFLGGIYSHTVEPLTFNPAPTDLQLGEKEGRGRINQFQYPLTSAISVRLGKNGLGDVAKAQGIGTIYYADIERWSAAFGLWSMEVVHIYGR